mgnify:CR=1 FL=1
MQLIAYMSIYEVNMPANIEIYVEEFSKMVKFEILKPDNLIGLVWPEVTIKSLLESSKTKLQSNVENSGYQSENFFVNNALYVAVALLFILVIAILFILQKFAKKVEGILKNILRKTFWNNMIRSFSISYLETSIGLMIATQAWL